MSIPRELREYSREHQKAMRQTEVATQIHVYDRDCQTPSSVQLSFNGRAFAMSCAPQKNHEKKALYDEMILCDPLLYGFFPKKEPAQGEGYGIAECLYPDHRVMTWQRAKQPGEEDVTNVIDTSKRFPERSTRHCDIQARTHVTEGLKKFFPGFGGDEDLSLFMAAKLALENQELWSRKKNRVKTYCGRDNLSGLEKSSCGPLLDRLLRVEEAIERLAKQKAGGGVTRETDL